MFGYIKRFMKDYEFSVNVKGAEKKLVLAYEIMKVMF